MPATLTQLLHRLRRLTARPGADSDAELLDGFARGHDESAFAALVARHGSMVLNVCRRLLGDAQAAEDAFQATFLVLARKARSVGRPAALAGWLYGVARRVALKARRANARRPGELRADAPEPADPRPDPLAEVTARDLLAVVEAEVARLPEVYRLPVLLVCLEGLSQEEAARRLGWTAGSVKGRLERGRRRLHARLARRGLTLPAALAATAVARAATVPAISVVSTVKAAPLFAAGKAAAPGTVPARAVALAEGVLRSMRITKFRAAAGLLLAACILAAGTGLLLGASTGGADGGKKGPAPAPAKGRVTEASAQEVASALADNHALADEKFIGKWLRVRGQMLRVRRGSADAPPDTYWLLMDSGLVRVKYPPAFHFAGKEARKRLATLERNEFVIVEGRCEGVTSLAGEEVILFRECKIVEVDQDGPEGR
jgi:RNA polymerase sigma factor (sigma-70 family)